uniref:Uncharacterized protein n=1 Tax=Cacopsylla melanoneura TaxID=428564 RepID=A0A8D9A450_9HEMI
MVTVAEHFSVFSFTWQCTIILPWYQGRYICSSGTSVRDKKFFRRLNRFNCWYRMPTWNPTNRSSPTWTYSDKAWRSQNCGFTSREMEMSMARNTARQGMTMMMQVGEMEQRR